MNNTPLTVGDFQPTEAIDGDPSSGLLLLCDHASNAVPQEYNGLGLPAEQYDRHIGYDIGARALTLELARRLDVPSVLTTYSRILIDPNRGEDDPTIIMRLSDGAVVPGNAKIDNGERTNRINRFHKPYHDLIDKTLDRLLQAAPPPIIISIHSFTPVWRGIPRPWHAGILWDSDERAVRPFIERLAMDADLVVGDNEPYDGALKNDTMYRHATQRGIAHALLEVRQDLIAEQDGVLEWADRLQPILEDLAQRPDLRQIKVHKSRSDLRG